MTDEKIKEAMALADDIYVDYSAVDTPVPGELFIFGEGITLETQREIDLAKELVRMIKVLRDQAK